MVEFKCNKCVYDVCLLYKVYIKYVPVPHISFFFSPLTQMYSFLTLIFLDICATAIPFQHFITRHQETWDPATAPTLTNHVTIGKSINLSEAWFPES